MAARLRPSQEEINNSIRPNMYSCGYQNAERFPQWRICDPSDRNKSHVGNFRIRVGLLYMVLKTTSLALK